MPNAARCAFWLSRWPWAAFETGPSRAARRPPRIFNSSDHFIGLLIPLDDHLRRAGVFQLLPALPIEQAEQDLEKAGDGGKPAHLTAGTLTPSTAKIL